MSNTIYLSYSALLYIILIAIVFFTKKKVESTENKIFKKLILISFVSLVSEIAIVYVPNDINYFPFVLVMKLYLICCVLWLSIFMTYVFVITRRDYNANNAINYKEKYQKIYNIFKLVVAIVCLLVLVLPINFYNQGGMKYSYGPSVDVTFLLAGIYTTIMVILILINFKQIKRKSYIPIIFLIIFLGIISLVQKINPSLLLVNAAFSFIANLMYFTIENPDVKIISELSKNRELTEKSFEDKSNALFKLTQEVRKPISEIIEISDALHSEDDVKLLKQGIDLMSDEAKNVSFIINNVLNLSSMDLKNIKEEKNTYNIKNLYKEIAMRVKDSLKDKNIKFTSTMSDDIPKSLYGDKIKLKQIILSIIDNSIKYTSDGFINLDIDAIVKYDIARLIITIEDSGCGINLIKLNEILRNEGELTKEEIRSLDKTHLDLKVVQKIVKYLGGAMLIESKKNRGTKVIIVLDQLLEKHEKDDIIKTIEKYENEIARNKKVLLINDDNKELEKFANIIRNNGFLVTTTMYDKDCVDRIKAGYKYDLIIVDDELDTSSGYECLKKLKKIKGFNIPVVVTLAKNKEFIKEHYIEDGFSDYIIKSSVKTELPKMLNKYL